MPGIESEPAWSTGEIPAEHAIRGFHGVSLLLDEAAPTGAILTDVFGFTEVGREGSLVRYKAGDTALGGIVDIREAGGFLPARHGRRLGPPHRLPRRQTMRRRPRWSRSSRENHGIRTTEQKDRNYFRSVYFREPGGILFEIATDDPGFAVDEPADRARPGA